MVEYHIDPDYMRVLGPFILVQVGTGQGTALLDTGAYMSSIDIDFAQSLRLPEEGTHSTRGATGEGTYPQFRADLHIPMLETRIQPPIGGLPLKSLGHPWDAIIGRDVLCQFEMTVNGTTGLIRFTSAS